ncbi:Vacuolar protein sorting-associated protein 41 [Coccidioides posadasii str. Silveira]|uniref:Vacuolar assembly protein n=1 Tax=Coccidioides posadasii (strain RMSCC 757 / Silveira) TaxID=443226 RepID=E9D032_COCPS|nr:vacuolar assembly protein [Coccidioides posadasii str. Silveira]QVM08623.1 Vacuolar protein sorting-associated protein 41 [Coccidioides posadasii str. Silveira]
MADDAILPEAGDSKSASSPSSSARERQAEQDNNHRSEEEYDDDDDEEEEEEEEEDEEESDGEDEDEEPRLKYVSFTKSIGPVYRNGDATSSFLVGGDKMIVGTHNGNILVFDASTFQRFRVYHAHSASVTSVSMSPFPPPLPSNTGGKNAPLADSSSRASVDLSKSPGQSRQTTVPHSPSNAIYIATSSIDGNVCVSSLLDPKDVLLRNFGRPVQAVALSPDYKSDKTYLSGGLAGDLVLTVGGRVGTSSNSTTMAGATASPSGWFGALGFGGNNGKDTVLHSGEGSISAIKWSLSGKYIVWVNEEGIKIMRSHLHLDNADSDFAWKRMNHVDRPRGPQWDEMAGVWKPRAEWIDEDTYPGGPGTGEAHTGQLKLDHRERLVVGWGGTIWVINVFPPGRDKDPRKNVIGSAEVVAILRTDCIVSGVSLYNPNVLLVLSYVASEDDGKSKRKQVGPTRGVRHRQNGLEPEIRLIDVETKEELSVDTLTMRRYESLSASDYHLGALPPAKILDTPIRRGTFETIGTGILDATLYPTRLFSSASSVRSVTSSGDRRSSLTSSLADAPVADHDSKELAILASEGIKIFIHSPYDCVVAVKRDVKDRLSWLKDHEKYEEAWELLQQHPEAVAQDIDEGESPLSTPKQRRGSVIGLFSEPVDRADNIKLEKERQNVGESWLEQLISNNNWEKAGEVCGKVLTTTPKWEHWIWIFAKNNKFDEIVSHVPLDIHPPLPGLVYEVILGHYVSRNHMKFKELLDLWPPNLFDIDSVIAAINEQIKSSIAAEEADESRLLTECLAQLFLAGGHYREALRCYIRLQDAETAMSLIREHHLLDAVADDVPGLILIRVSKDQIKSASISELEAATSEPIKLLVREAVNGIVHPATVISQLQAADLHLFLYFYVRALWKGDFLSTTTDKGTTPIRGHHRTSAADKLVADEGRLLIDAFADTVVELFADYDRPLLMDFLQSNTSYSYNAACATCELRHFTPELIYLFSKTGQTKRALHLILSDLRDVSHAISFAKSQDDPDLWEDLLSYSMDKPEYIRCLLVEAGTAIDPITLVKRIPSGLEIQGLREGLTRMIREHDIQASISQGVAKVLAGEVSMRMDTLRKGQRRGIKFDIVPNEEAKPTSAVSQHNEPKEELDAKGNVESSEKKQTFEPGRCAGCHSKFIEQEKEPLVGFACGHVYHLSHLHLTPRGHSSGEGNSQLEPPQSTLYEDSSPLLSRTVGLKVTNARLLREKIGDGCQICASKRVTQGQ